MADIYILVNNVTAGSFDNKGMFWKYQKPIKGLLKDKYIVFAKTVKNYIVVSWQETYFKGFLQYFLNIY